MIAGPDQEEMPIKPLTGLPSPTKAKKILKDGKVGGRPLSDNQRQFFGMIASGKIPTHIKDIPAKVRAQLK